MDFGDIGSDITEKNVAERIAEIQKEANRPKLLLTGTCYNVRCGDASPGRRFCSVACRDEYDKMLKAIR